MKRYSAWIAIFEFSTRFSFYILLGFFYLYCFFYSFSLIFLQGTVHASNLIFFKLSQFLVIFVTLSFNFFFLVVLRKWYFFKLIHWFPKGSDSTMMFNIFYVLKNWAGFDILINILSLSSICSFTIMVSGSLFKKISFSSWTGAIFLTIMSLRFFSFFDPILLLLTAI